jgi:3-phenylpropionate/trans-cinnamate dioxygenase subunit alpha
VSIDITSAVDWERGEISAQIFVDPEIYQAELERVFGRAWLFLAHDSMIPKPNDFFSTYMGGDPVIVVRQRDGSVKALLNSCRHRGMKVCRADMGNAKAFTCTYHGWSYGEDGTLQSVPHFEDAYFGELDMPQWGLKQAPKVESYKGFYFGTWSDEAPSLVEYLGDMTYYLDSCVDYTEDGVEFMPGVVKWKIGANWKLGAEQYVGDAYHASMTHLSSFGQFDPNFQQQFMGPGRQFSSRQGHGMGFLLQRANERQASGVATDAMMKFRQEAFAKASARLGADQAGASGHWGIFPNVGGLGANHLRLFHPTGPNSCELWTWVIVDKGAPDEIKQLAMREFTRNQNVAGMAQTDDGENWAMISAVLAGSPQARQQTWNYQLGLGHDLEPDPVYPGRVGTRFYGETPQRGYYRRWQEFMTSESWPHVQEGAYDAVHRNGAIS